MGNSGLEIEELFYFARFVTVFNVNNMETLHWEESRCSFLNFWGFFFNNIEILREEVFYTYHAMN